MDDIFDGLHQMLNTIRAEYLNRDIYYYTYRLLAHKPDQPPKSLPLWQTIKRALFTKEPSLSDDLPSEVDPWSEGTVQFWALVGANPQFHDLAKNWLNSVEALLAYANEAPSSTMGVWEYDETQFAEPAIATLVFSDVSFVPFYTKLLGLWDMKHEVFQVKAINAIIDKYGLCPETEDLIICRMVEGFGQLGDENMEYFYPALEAHYGDLAQSEFLHRMISRQHKAAVAWCEKDVAKATERLAHRRKTDPGAKMPEIPQPEFGRYMFSEKLVDSAQRIFDALEKERLS
jgi:hypothetical protein